MTISYQARERVISRIYDAAKRFPVLRTMFGSTWRAGRSTLWNVRRRVWPARPVMVPCGDGYIKMEPEGQIAEMLWGRQFELRQREFIARYVKEGMEVVNIGANAGLYTLMASKLVGAGGKVYAFEPSSENFDRLQRNLKLNGCRNVVAEKMALSDISGTLSLRRDPGNPGLDGHFYIDRNQEVSDAGNVIEAVPCRTLDDYLRERGGARGLAVDLIAIDVEGAEYEAFVGSRETFLQSPSLVIFFECTQKVDEIGALMREHGFRLFEWDAVSGAIVETGIKKGHLLAARSPVALT